MGVICQAVTILSHFLWGSTRNMTENWGTESKRIFIRSTVTRETCTSCVLGQKQVECFIRASAQRPRRCLSIWRKSSRNNEPSLWEREKLMDTSWKVGAFCIACSKLIIKKLEPELMCKSKQPWWESSPLCFKRSFWQCGDGYIRLPLWQAPTRSNGFVK